MIFCFDCFKKKICETATVTKEKTHFNEKNWKFTKFKMTSPAATLTDFEATAINETSNIHYSRPATIFAAVAASIFTFVGITGKKLIYYS